MYRINFSGMDIGTSSAEKKLSRRIRNLEGMYVAFGPRPPRGGGGMGFLAVAVAVLTSIAIQKQANRLK